MWLHRHATQRAVAGLREEKLGQAATGVSKACSTKIAVRMEPGRVFQSGSHAKVGGLRNFSPAPHMRSSVPRPNTVFEKNSTRNS